MDAAVVAALIASGTSLVVGLSSLWLQRRTAEESLEDARRTAAKVVLDRYRGPLLSAASELGDRIENIRHRDFLDYVAPGSGRETEAKLTTLFRFAQYFGWREVLRTEVQLLRFDSESDTQVASAFIYDVIWVLSSDALGQKRSMLWSDEQRAIGELMVVPRPDGTSTLLGYATFVREYERKFKDWLDDLADDLLTPTSARGDRLRLLQWALFGLAGQLDEERVHTSRTWMQTAQTETRDLGKSDGLPPVEARLIQDLRRAGLGRPA